MKQKGQNLRGTKRRNAGEPIIRTEISVSVETLKNYIGNYELTPNFVISITEKEGSLFAQATGQKKLEIYAESDKMFFYKEINAQIEFVENSGKIEALILYQDGSIMRASKIPE